MLCSILIENCTSQEAGPDVALPTGHSFFRHLGLVKTILVLLSICHVQHLDLVTLDLEFRSESERMLQLNTHRLKHQALSTFKAIPTQFLSAKGSRGLAPMFIFLVPAALVSRPEGRDNMGAGR